MCNRSTQEGLEMLSCEHDVNWLFCSSHFSVQSRGWTRCPLDFSVFSFYDWGGINVQIETFTSRCPSAGIVSGDSNVDVAPAPFLTGDPVMPGLLPVSWSPSGTKHAVQTQSPAP